MSARLIVASDFDSTAAQTGVDSTLEGSALLDPLLSAIADRRRYPNRDVDHGGWVVTLYHLEEQAFYGNTHEEARAWRLVWLMFPEIGIGQVFLISCAHAFRTEAGG